jgi:hypothetical protein
MQKLGSGILDKHPDPQHCFSLLKLYTFWTFGHLIFFLIDARFVSIILPQSVFRQYIRILPILLLVSFSDILVERYGTVAFLK